MPTTTTGVATTFIDFTRASNATVTDSDGRVKWAPHNLLTNSESFDAAAWAKENTTVDANVASAPNGTSTAELLKNTTASGVHGTYFTFAGLDATSGLRLSCFVKKNTVRYVALGMWNASGTSECGAGFDLDTGTGVAGAVGAGYSASNPSITSVGSGWYLISVTVVTPASSNYATIINRSTSYSSGRISEVYTGATSESTYIWGASLYRSDLGGMQANTSAYPMYNPTTPKNLVGYSEDFTAAAYWTNIDTADVTTGITNPRGLSGATLFYPTSSGTDRIIYRASIVGGTVSTPYTLSVYAKASGINFLYFGTFGGGTGTPSLCAFFDLQNGTKTQTGSYFTSASITPVGDGWYRCTATANATLAGVYPIFGVANANNSNTVTASGTSGIYLWGAQLSDSASLDPYVPVYGAAVTSAAYYGPRRDFDGATLACKGLLVEEQRTNTILNSSVFSGWTKATATVLDNQVAGPDGTVTAGVIAATAANGEIYTQVTSTSGVAHAGSIYVKRKTGTGSVYLIDAAGGRILVTASITTGSWTRISVTANSVSVNPFFGIRLATSGDELYLWGAQLEPGSFATSYIPVGATTAGATRLADEAKVSTAAFPYSATEGALVANGSVLSTAAANRGAFTLASAGGYISIGNNVSGLGATNADFYTLPAGTFLTASGAVSAGTPFKEAAVYKASDFALSANGAAAVTSSSGALPTAATDAYIGRIGSSSGYFNGHIRQITYLPRRISNTELQTRTA